MDVSFRGVALGGRELEVERLQAAKEVRRQVLVAAGVGRAVLILGDGDVPGPVEEPVE